MASITESLLHLSVPRTKNQKFVRVFLEDVSEKLEKTFFFNFSNPIMIIIDLLKHKEKDLV